MIKKEDWKILNLGEMCELYQPKTISQQEMVENGKYDVYGANGIIGKYDKYNHEYSELLMTCRGATCGTMNVSRPYSWINGNAMVIHPKQIDDLYLQFLHYQLKAIDLKDVITGAAQPQITRQTLTKLKIVVPPISTQHQIVSELDALSDIISKKKQQLEELDKLAQATFYDMFGDPVSNEKGWEIGFLKDHTTKIGSGATPSGGNQSYKSEGISLIRSMNVHNGIFRFKDLAFIDEVQAKQLNNVTILENDVLINITGASVARSCIVPKTILPARVNQHVSIIRLKSNLNYVFVNSLFISHSYQEKLLSLGKSNGATREAITKSQLEKLEIPLPPISYQLNFSQKIGIIETQKELINKSIADVQQSNSC